MTQDKSKGIALISVLFIAAVVLILASTFIYMVYRERQATTATRLISDSLQTADAITERARLEMIHTYESSNVTPAKFVKDVYTVLHGGSSSIAAINTYTNSPQAVTINGKTGWWKIVEASEVTNVSFPPSNVFIDIAATSETGSGVQTIIRRIDMGQSKIFDLAMLSERTDCIYCHLRVNGDVGSIKDLRPGWGEEGGNGIGSGGHMGGSRINGDTFIAGKASNDDTDLSGDPVIINGAQFEGNVEEDSRSSRLPTDDNGDGLPDFPVLKREIGLKNVDGTVSGGKIYTVPNGTVLSSVPISGNQVSLTGKYDGNVILEGTPSDPIVLDGDLYFSGDVIIKGYVKGRGAIYSGRNTYLAGNINYVDPPPNCATAGNPSNCAENAINNNKDELRLASRGNIIVGDYTQKNFDGSDKVWQELQAAEYFKSQFGLYEYSRCYDSQTGDELNLVGGDYQNVEGEIIAGSFVTCPADSYSYSMRPGKVNTDGSFTNWLSDGLYKNILDTEQRTYDTWRFHIDRSTLTATSVQEQFAKYNLHPDSINDILTHPLGSFDIKNTANEIIGTVNWSDTTIRVMIDKAFSYEKQVTRVDAFLYANQRIAGKTFNAPVVINGGMIAKEIGILAPGIEKPGFLSASRYAFMDTPGISNPADCGDDDFIENFIDNVDLNGDGISDSDDKPEMSPLFQPDSEDCALTINYDERMRNGGLGYNLISPRNIGRTLTWQIADDASQQVRP
jgi:hypothetical protein